MSAWPNHELEQGVFRVAGMLALVARLEGPVIGSVYVHATGHLAFVCDDRHLVDELAAALGMTGPPRLEIFGDGAWASYSRSADDVRIQANEHPPFAPIGDETAANTAADCGGCSLHVVEGSDRG